jgi:hypothetical protein
MDTLWISLLACGLLLLTIERLAAFLLKNGDPSRLVLLTVTGVGAVAAATLHTRVSSAHDFKDAVIVRPIATVERIAVWARHSTPIDAVFLVDPGSSDWEIFRGLSQRSDYITWVEGGAINWDRSFALPWMERLSAIGFDVTAHAEDAAPSEQLKILYAGLADEDVSQLKQRYPIDYWVVPADHASRFPIAF